MVNHPPSPIIPRVKSRGLTGGAGAEGNGFLEMLRKHGGCHELSWGFNSLTPVCHFWGFNSLTPAAEYTELELEFGQKKPSLYLTHQLHHANPITCPQAIGYWLILVTHGISAWIVPGLVDGVEEQVHQCLLGSIIFPENSSWNMLYDVVCHVQPFSEQKNTYMVCFWFF